MMWWLMRAVCAVVSSTNWCARRTGRPDTCRRRLSGSGSLPAPVLGKIAAASLPRPRMMLSTTRPAAAPTRSSGVASNWRVAALRNSSKTVRMKRQARTQCVLSVGTFRECPILTSGAPCAGISPIATPTRSPHDEYRMRSVRSAAAVDSIAKRRNPFASSCPFASSIAAFIRNETTTASERNSLVVLTRCWLLRSSASCSAETRLQRAMMSPWRCTSSPV
mmetsp:Transcript_28640/g.88744  ORF Transcript_28640/g.88744 Transcript_28640/m.88744 type:complete len:221 (-) Transcript_28640:1272-1934(-)